MLFLRLFTLPSTHHGCFRPSRLCDCQSRQGPVPPPPRRCFFSQGLFSRVHGLSWFISYPHMGSPLILFVELLYKTSTRVILFSPSSSSLETCSSSATSRGDKSPARPLSASPFSDLTPLLVLWGARVDFLAVKLDRAGFFSPLLVLCLLQRPAVVLVGPRGFEEAFPSNFTSLPPLRVPFCGNIRPELSSVERLQEDFGTFNSLFFSGLTPADVLAVARRHFQASL